MALSIAPISGKINWFHDRHWTYIAIIVVVIIIMIIIIINIRYIFIMYYLEAEGKGFVWPLVSASCTAFEMSLPTAFITSTSSRLSRVYNVRQNSHQHYFAHCIMQSNLHASAMSHVNCYIISGLILDNKRVLYARI